MDVRQAFRGNHNGKGPQVLLTSLPHIIVMIRYFVLASDRKLQPKTFALSQGVNGNMPM